MPILHSGLGSFRTAGTLRQIVQPFGPKLHAPLFHFGLAVSRGWEKRMGVPESYFAKMVAAVQARNGIGVHRANKEAAIDLMDQGAIPKGQWAKFKSDPKTGVLTAKSVKDRFCAYEAGYYIVLDSARAVRTVSDTVTEELSLANIHWTAQPGQVVNRSRGRVQPVVGDLDLLAFVPLESPGRNMVLVPDDHEKGDWIGPDVRRYADELNALLDIDRVLHGANDGYFHPVHGGFTDDLAYAIFPDGSVHWMNGRGEQEAFFKAIGRETILGKYTSSPDITVPDQLAAMRNRPIKPPSMRK